MEMLGGSLGYFSCNFDAGIEDFEQAEGRLPGHVTSQDLPALLAFWHKMCDSQV